MNAHHASKSISFLMELIFVLFFFTIASAIAVFVLSSAKEKNDYALHAKNAIFFGENLIQEQSSYLQEDQFYLDEEGHATTVKDVYKVIIKRVALDGLTQSHATLEIQRDGKHLVTMSFLDEGESS